ncbi:MAG: NTP transferase domain-containing protein [Armatimonadetes bacterium]|nr:NTP transferase domain-containing protein [Armatimonadota bacterium]
MYPVTKSLPKEMLPLGRKPAIQLVAEETFACGFSSIIVVTAVEKHAVENHFDAISGNGDPGGASEHLFPEALKGDGKFFYVRQNKPLGLGHAILTAAEFIQGEPFGVALGDAVIASPGPGEPVLARMLRVFAERRPQAVVAVREVQREQLSRYGVIVPSHTGDGFIDVAGIVEKPAAQDAPSNLAVSGRYLFAPDIIQHLQQIPAGRNNEIQLTDAIQSLINDGGKVLAVPLLATESRYDVGGFEEYAKAFVEVALQDGEFGPSLREHIRGLV